MNILDVQEYLADTLLPAVAITDPMVESIKRAYATVPDARMALAVADLPCAMMPTHELQTAGFKSGFLGPMYAIKLQVFIAPATMEQGHSARMAHAFEAAIIAKCSGAMRLGGNVSLIRDVRGERETVAVLEWAGIPYVGLDMWIDVTLKEAKAHSA